MSNAFHLENKGDEDFEYDDNWDIDDEDEEVEDEDDWVDWEDDDAFYEEEDQRLDEEDDGEGFFDPEDE